MGIRKKNLRAGFSAGIFCLLAAGCARLLSQIFELAGGNSGTCAHFCEQIRPERRFRERFGGSYNAAFRKREERVGDNGQPFCLRRAFHFEITRRNVLSSARKAGISAAPAETRGSQARAIMASLKLDFPVKNVQVFGRYRRNPPNSYGRPLFVVAFLLYWCKKGAQFLHALKYRFAPAAVFYSPRRTFPFRRIILW